VTLEITRDIAEVTAASREISSSSEQVNLNARGLAELSTQLNGQVNKFKVQRFRYDVWLRVPYPLK